MSNPFETPVGKNHTVNTVNGDEKLRFTVIDANEPESGRHWEALIQVRKTNTGKQVWFKMPNVYMDEQQMAEFGWLLVALAGKDVDHDSAADLLDGYEIPLPESLKELIGE